MDQVLLRAPLWDIDNRYGNGCSESKNGAKLKDTAYLRTYLQKVGVNAWNHVEQR